MSDSANMMSPNRLTELVSKAKKSGADHADAVFFTGKSNSVSWRLGKLEDVERSENSDLGLRVIIGKNQAIVSSSDMSNATLDELVSRALDMAKNTPEDPYSGLADKKLLALDKIPDLDLYDDCIIDEKTLKNIVTETEAHALETSGITNSEGASASSSQGSITLANSDGFLGHYKSRSRRVVVGACRPMSEGSTWSLRCVSSKRKLRAGE